MSKRLIRCIQLVSSFIFITAAGCGSGGGSNAPKEPVSSNSSSSSSSSGSSSSSSGSNTLAIDLPAPSISEGSINTVGETKVAFFTRVTTPSEKSLVGIELEEVDENNNLIKNLGELTNANGPGSLYRFDMTFNGGQPGYRYFRLRANADGASKTSDKTVLWVSDLDVRKPFVNEADIKGTDVNLDSLKSYNLVIILNPNSKIPPTREILDKALESVNGKLIQCIPQLNQCLAKVDNLNIEEVVKNLQLKSDGFIKDAYLDPIEIVPTSGESSIETKSGEQSRWHLDRIAHEEAWQLMDQTQHWLGVGVIDNGVRCARINDIDDASGPNSGPNSCINSFSILEKSNHATGVASIITAPRVEGSPTHGISPLSKVYSYNYISRDKGQFPLQMMLALANQNPDTWVLNLSLDWQSNSFKRQEYVIDAMCTAAASGRLMVIAAGNNECKGETYSNLVELFHQTKCGGKPLKDSVLVVGATDSENNLAKWLPADGKAELCSNQKHADIYAPGEDIVVRNYKGKGAEETGFWTTDSGTSYAAPMVSGAAALVWSANPSLTSKEVRKILIDNAVVLKKDGIGSANTLDPKMEGQRFLNIYNAVLATKSKPPTASSSSSSSSGKSSSSSSSSGSAKPSSSSSSSSGSYAPCIGEPPALSEGMKIYPFNPIVVAPAQANTDWYFSPTGGSCTVGCKDGYQQKNNLEQCEKKPADQIIRVSVFEGPDKLATGSAMMIRCYSPSKMAQFHQYTGINMGAVLNGLADINITQCKQEGSDTLLQVDGGITKGIATSIADVVRTSRLNLESALCYGSLPRENFIINPRPGIDISPVNNKWIYGETEQACSFRCRNGYVPHFGSNGSVDNCIIDNGVTANDYCPINAPNKSNCIGINVAIDNLSAKGRYNVVVHTPTKSGWRGCLTDEVNPANCNDINNYFFRPEDTVFNFDSLLEKNGGAVWNAVRKTYTSDLVWPELSTGKKYVGVANDNYVFTVMAFDYKKADHANDYCPIGSSSLTCAPIDIVIENLSTKGILHLVVHVPTKNGWKSCASPGSKTCEPISEYNQTQSPYENNADWTWSESDKTWSFNKAWKELPSGTYSIGVANGAAVFKTIDIVYKQ